MACHPERDRHDTTRHDTTEIPVSRIDIRSIQVQIEERYIATIERLQAGHREEVERLVAAHAETVAAKDGDLSKAGMLIDELRRRAAEAEIRQESAISERDQVQAERDELRVLVEALKERDQESPVASTEAPQERPGRPWWRFWRD